MQGIQNVLLVAYLLIVLALIAVILLQRSEGGGLGMGGSTGGLMTVRGSANLLTRTTAVLAALFFATAIALTILSSIDHGTSDLLNNSGNAAASTAPLAPGAASTAPASQASGTVLDQLQQLQSQTASSTAPADTNTPVQGNDQGLALPLNLAQPQTASTAPAASTGAASAAPSASAPPEPASSAPANAPAQ
jgi:preprotein translocase subunit SecG